jgi:hypothetical protein
VDIALLSIQYSVFSIVVENVIHIDVSRPLNWKKPGEHSFLQENDYRVCEKYSYIYQRPTKVQNCTFGNLPSIW